MPKVNANSDSKLVKWSVFAVVAIFAVILFLDSYTIVGTGQRGVVVHLGHVTGEVLGEGLHFKIPFYTSVPKIGVKVNLTTIEASAASLDMQKVDSHLGINWHLNPSDVAQIYQTIGDEGDIETKILQQAANEVLKAATAKKTAEQILTQRADLKEVVDANLKQWTGKYGIVVDDVSILNADFSKEFNDAIERKQVAEQGAQQAVYNAQKAKADADAAVNSARGQRDAQQLVLQTLTPAILRQQLIAKWNGILPVYMGGGGNASLLISDLFSSASAGISQVRK